MIIGITGKVGSGKTEISRYLNGKYNFRHIEVDKIIEKYIADGKLAKIKRYLSDELGIEPEKDIDIVESFFGRGIENHLMDLNFKREIDNIILNEVKKYPDETVVIDWFFLEKSAVFSQCDILIKSEVDYDLRKRRYIERAGKIDMAKFCHLDDVHDDNLSEKYHLVIDTAKPWKEKLSQFIDLNVQNRIKISVVVPIYNAEEYLNKCVTSIQNQSYQNLEIILVNDGSTDGSLTICEELAKKDKRIKVISQNNGGLSNARNKGIDVATGYYIGFVDADDYICNTMYENLLKNALNSGADISCGHAFVHSRDGKIINLSDDERLITTPTSRKGILNAHLSGMITTAVWDKLFKLDAIRGIRFNESLFNEDAGFMMDLCLKSNSFVCDTNQYYHYIKRRGMSLTGRKFDERFFSTEIWGEDVYQQILNLGTEYKSEAEKVFFNSLSHVLKTYARDYSTGILENYYCDDIQRVVNKIINLLFISDDISQFHDIDNVLKIIELLLKDKVIDQEQFPKITLPCIGILWNSLQGGLMDEAIEMLSTKAIIKDITFVDLGDQYRPFLDEIYLYNNEKIGVTIFKANVLIDRYATNTIAIVQMNIDISRFIHYSQKKGYMYKEIAEIKDWIREYFMNKIDEYAFDNVFHLTVDMEEYEFTKQICEKYVWEPEQKPKVMVKTHEQQ